MVEVHPNRSVGEILLRLDKWTPEQFVRAALILAAEKVNRSVDEFFQAELTVTVGVDGCKRCWCQCSVDGHNIEEDFVLV